MIEYNLAVVGATGAVGMEMIKTLAQRQFPVKNLKLLASNRSKGKKLSYLDKTITVEELDDKSFNGVDIALFSAGAAVSKHFAPIAAQSGTVVIDNSSAWRMDTSVPLVVPEVNPEDAFKHKGIIANPNCSTIQMVVVLNPIHKISKIKRIVVSTYQAVSGSGLKAIEELLSQSRAILNNEKVKISVYPHRIAFNVLPQIDVFLNNRYTKEEMKMVNETKKILGDDSIRVTATCVRVPVVRGHSESINIETEKKLSAEDVISLLKDSPGITVIDNIDKNEYPLSVDAAYKDDTFVGRIREDESIENGLNLWVVSDNLRKGAALNAVQIAELLIK